MSGAPEVAVLKDPNALHSLLWAGFACGVLDITAAFVVYGFFGLKPMRLLQGIASGLLGPNAFKGGVATALLGLLCHFVIAFGAAAVYVFASRAIPFLIPKLCRQLDLWWLRVSFGSHGISLSSRLIIPA